MWSFFYKIPRVSLLVTIMIIFGGLGALFSVTRLEDPKIIERFGTGLVFLPGASPERMEALILSPLEDRLTELPEIQQVFGRANAGAVNISFGIQEAYDEREVDEAWTKIRQQVDLAKSEFPEGTFEPIIERNSAGASTLLISFKWQGEGDIPRAILARFAKDLQKQFQNLDGTEATEVFGEIEEEIRVSLNHDKLINTGLSLGQAAQIVAAADAKAPAGNVNANNNITVEISGEFDSLARIRNVILQTDQQGRQLRLGDIADIKREFQTPRQTLAFSDGAEAVILSIIIEPGRRLDTYAAKARQLVEDYQSQIPETISADIVFDQSIYMETRLGGLARNLLASAIIVFIVLFFLMGWRAALIVGSALPMTMLLVMILFRIFNLDLHQMSMTGLVIALGLLIDNAIVVVDEYEQKRARGLSIVLSIEAALKHLFGPLFASTLTTVLAFAPVPLQPGPAGEFIGMMGISVIFAITSSFLLAMTLVPAFAGWFDKKDWGRSRPKRFWRDGLNIPLFSEGYRYVLHHLLRLPILGIGIGIIGPILGVLAFGQLTLQFFPPTDRDTFQFTVEMPVASSAAKTAEKSQEVVNFIKSYEEVEHVHWFVGETSPRVYYNAMNFNDGLSNIATGFVKTSSNRATKQIVPNLQKETKKAFPEAIVLIQPFEQGPPVNAPIEYRIIGPDPIVLDRIGDEVRAILYNLPGIVYTRGIKHSGLPVFHVEVGRDITGFAGLTPNELAAHLRIGLDGVRVGSVLEDLEEIPVILGLDDESRGSLVALKSRSLPGRDGEAAPLGALAEISLTPDAQTIMHYNGERVNVVSAFLDPYLLPGPIQAAADKAILDANILMPAGTWIEIGGNAEESGEALTSFAGAAIPLILAMFGAVALVFNSFRVASLVFASGFMSVMLSFIGVWTFSLPIGFNSFVGAAGLLGVAINGTIVVLSAIRADPLAASGDLNAQREVVIDATRHIVATTLTTIGGFLPLILSRDVFWLPLAAGMAFGVIGSAILALIFAPCAYRLIARKVPYEAENPDIDDANFIASH